ncbi:MAG: hypothetical protein AVDCRST_MAG10-2254, partial [uncultured Acidimicrobiales bacterium]
APHGGRTEPPPAGSGPARRRVARAGGGDLRLRPGLRRRLLRGPRRHLLHDRRGAGHPGSRRAVEPGHVLDGGRGRHARTDLSPGHGPRGVNHRRRQRRPGRQRRRGRADVRHARLVGVLPVTQHAVGDRLGALEQLRQARSAGAGPRPPRAAGRHGRRAGHRRAARDRRARRLRHPLRPRPSQGDVRPPGGRRGRPDHVPRPGEAGKGPGRGMGRRLCEVPGPHHRPGQPGLEASHGGHRGQPPVALPRPAARPTAHRCLRGRGALDGGPGGLRLRAAPHRHPHHARRPRGGRARPDRRPHHRGRRRSRGRGRSPDLPGSHLPAPHPAGAGHLPVLASQLVVEGLCATAADRAPRGSGGHRPGSEPL